MNRELLSLLIQVSCLIFLFILCFYTNKFKIMIGVAVLLMIVINFIAQILIAGEGPGACVGIIALPYLGVLVVFVAFGIKRWVRNKKITKVHNDIGNT